MEQITAFFEGIDWDAVMVVVTEHITKIEIKPFADQLWALLQQVIDIVAGGILG